MIGPHEGKELELMLAGEKHLAIFHDAIEEGYTPSEAVIPERAFSEYVQQGLIIRHAKIVDTPKEMKIQYVCFTPPSESWRAHAFFWLHSQCLSGHYKFDEFYEYFVGRLLGYTDEDIAHFIQHQKKFKNA